MLIKDALLPADQIFQSAPLTLLKPKMSAVTGADLPSEIIHHVLNELWYSKAHPDTSETFNYKRGLSTCSQVCRYWAKIVRPLLFEYLKLESIDDVLQLQRFIDSGSPADIDQPLRRCVHDVTIQQRGPQTAPWMHHVSRLLRRLDDVNVMLHIVNTAPHEAKQDHTSIQLRSFLPSHLLPRALPTSFIPLHGLILQGTCFVSRVQLTRILGGLPLLQSCECRRVSFADDTADLAQNRPHKYLRATIVERCTNRTVHDQLSLAITLWGGTLRLSFDDDALSAVCCQPSKCARFSAV